MGRVVGGSLGINVISLIKMEVVTMIFKLIIKEERGDNVGIRKIVEEMLVHSNTRTWQIFQNLEQREVQGCGCRTMELSTTRKSRESK